MKKYRIQTVPTKRGAFIRSRIDKNRHRAEWVGMIYLFATVVVSILGCRAMFSSVYGNMGLKQFWKPLVAMDLGSAFGVMSVFTSLIYVLMMAILLINGLRALTHLKYLFKKKVSRVYGLNANIGAMDTLGNIFSSSFTTVVVFNVLLYILQGGMAWSPSFLVDAPYDILAIGIIVHILCGLWGGKVSAFYIEDGSTVVEHKRPYGRFIPFIRNLLQLAAVFYISYLFLTSEQIHTVINVYLREGGFASLMENVMGLAPVALQALSFICICCLFKHAFSGAEFSVEGPYAPGKLTFRIATFFLTITSGLTVACKYLIGEAVYTIPDIQGSTFTVATQVGLDMNALIIAVVAFVMFLLDCILRLRWTKEAREEAEEVSPRPVAAPAPNIKINLPPPTVSMQAPAQRPTPVNVYVPQQQLPAMPPINVHVPRQEAVAPNVNVHMPATAVPNVNVQMPRMAPINVHVPMQQQATALPPINVHVPRQAPMAAQPINIQMPAQKPMAMPPINVNVPMQQQSAQPINVHMPRQASVAAQPINIQMPAQRPMVMPPINVHVPMQQQAGQPINVQMPAPAAQPINIQMPAQKQMAMPPIMVNVPQQQQAAQPINVHMPAPAAQPINIQMPAQKQMAMPPIMVNVPQQQQAAQPITVNVPQQKVVMPPINVNVPMQQQAAQPIQVNVPAPAAQPINVHMPAQANATPINVNVPAATTPVNVNVPMQQPAPINVQVPEQKRQNLTVPPLSLLHLVNEDGEQETVQQAMPPINAQVLEQPVPQQEEVKEEPEKAEEKAPIIAPIVAPIVVPTDDEEEEEEAVDTRSWQLRCPTCSRLIKTNGGTNYHRCPCCGKVFQLHKKIKNILDE